MNGKVGLRGFSYYRNGQGGNLGISNFSSYRGEYDPWARFYRSLALGIRLVVLPEAQVITEEEGGL